jgi:hypothetical protein
MDLPTAQILDVCHTLAEIALVVVLTPTLWEYNATRRERRLRVDLNIDTVDPRKSSQPVYGVEKLLAEVNDLIDRVVNPKAYQGLHTGNEILIVGPAQSGKKALAMHIAKMAGINRVIVVYNPSDPDVLARAKNIIEKELPAGKTMLLLPGLEYIDGAKEESWHDQLDALIETASNLPQILVVGTTNKYDRHGEVASWFGTVLSLPDERSPEWRDMLRQTAGGFLDACLGTGYLLQGIEKDAFVSRITEVAVNQAEIKDIVALCQTTALYEKRQSKAPSPVITPHILETAIQRAIPRLHVLAAPAPMHRVSSVSQYIEM